MLTRATVLRAKAALPHRAQIIPEARRREGLGHRGGSPNQVRYLRPVEPQLMKGSVALSVRRSPYD
eukprot:SAG11_NODE_17519_length_516_cov_0.714628_1_plen_66_part_00